MNEERYVNLHAYNDHNFSICSKWWLWIQNWVHLWYNEWIYLYSFENSDVVVQGTVSKIDTLDISEILTAESIIDINKDSLNRSECAKKVLKSKKVLRTKISVDKNFKGLSPHQEIYIITPLQDISCGYREFNLGESYIIYGTKNITADIYFLWTFDKDFFKLKQEYSIWTNACKRTKLADEGEIQQLNEIK